MRRRALSALSQCARAAGPRAPAASRPLFAQPPCRLFAAAPCGRDSLRPPAASCRPPTPHGRRHCSTAAAATALDAGALHHLAGPGPAQAASEVASLVPPSNVFILSLQQAIEYLHTAGGLPWWGAIAATTLALRALIAPLVLMQMRNTARLAKAQPELARLQARMQEQLGSADAGAQAEYARQLSEVWAKHGCHPVRSMAPLLAQAPLFVCFFLAVQRMAVLPSFESGGALWFTNLAVADSTYGMPVLSSLAFLATVELGSGVPGAAANPSAANVKLGLRALAVAMVPLTASFPQGVFVYWITSNVCSFAQSLALRHPALKGLVNVPPPGAPPPGADAAAAARLAAAAAQPGATEAMLLSQRPGGAAARARRQPARRRGTG